jgi:hypothetical protein
VSQFPWRVEAKHGRQHPSFLPRRSRTQAGQLFDFVISLAREIVTGISQTEARKMAVSYFTGQRLFKFQLFKNGFNP